jgi:serine/threonine protein kinase
LQSRKQVQAPLLSSFSLITGTLDQVTLSQARKAGSHAHLSESTVLHQSLHHPCIVSLFSSFTTFESTLQVLELCTRGSLSEYIHSRSLRRLSEAQTRSVLHDLVDALTYLRKRLILHRDIKAGNVLLNEGYQIVGILICCHVVYSCIYDKKLADFGLAQRLETSSSTATTFCGSPNYVSPSDMLPFSSALPAHDHAVRYFDANHIASRQIYGRSDVS